MIRLVSPVRLNLRFASRYSLLETKNSGQIHFVAMNAVAIIPPFLRVRWILPHTIDLTAGSFDPSKNSFDLVCSKQCFQSSLNAPRDCPKSYPPVNSSVRWLELFFKCLYFF